MKQIPAEHLRSIRDDLDVADVIRTLEIPVGHRGRRLTFRCPDCTGFHTALNPERNLAYCFPCGRPFNTIDLVMAERDCTFLQAVAFLECLLG
jgi:DNA primase